MSIAVVMGSNSDLAVMEPAIDVLREFAVPSFVRVVSAHRDPRGMLEFAAAARADGAEIIIAGAGGAAYLPGMIAAATTLPVNGVPVGRPHLDGLDSLLSIAQMPAGVPVVTIAIDGSHNGSLLAIRILALGDPTLAAAIEAHRESLRDEVASRNTGVQALLAARDHKTTSATDQED